jgi:hypothetical protein
VRDQAELAQHRSLALAYDGPAYPLFGGATAAALDISMQNNRMVKCSGQQAQRP